MIDINSNLWTFGRVPDGYWESRTNRVRYMDWLSDVYAFEKAEDWYAISRMHFRNNHGGGLLMSYYRDSPLDAIRDYMPDYDWKPWLFKRTPQGYWHDPANRVAYMDWLGVELGFEEDSDWYEITQRDFFLNAGGGLLATVYSFSPQAAMHDYRPDYPWLPWLFRSVPKGFWLQRRNRIEYLNWLGRRMGMSTREDWNQIRQRDFCTHGGSGLLMNVYGGSPQRAVKEFFDVQEDNAPQENVRFAADPDQLDSLVVV